MSYNEYETVYLKDQVSRCEEAEDIKGTILPLLMSQKEQWAKKVNDMIAQSEYKTKSKFGEVCGVSRATVNNWCKGVLPKDREQLLIIGLAAGYGRAEIDQLLQRYGRFRGLYAKNREDCVCLYVLGKDYGSEALNRYKYISEKIKNNIFQPSFSEDMATEIFAKKLSDIKAEDELEEFIEDNSAIFANSYHRFYSYVTMYIRINYEQYGENVHELSKWQNWSSTLRKTVSEIRQKKWNPTRNQIISLGLHLNMDQEQINKMLEMVHMEQLCAKNPFECAIMYILDNAELNNLLDCESEDYDPDALCNYARLELSKFDVPEMIEFLTSELAEPEDDEEW